jgi:hypothetical protein
MSVTMVCLVGEQPIPNLLPILHYHPDAVVLVHSDYTERVADRLQAVVTQEQPGISVRKCLVEPYSVDQIYRELERTVGSQRGPELLVNLTGGTKPMMLAAFQLALARKTPSFYFKSEGLLNEVYFFQETSLPVPSTTPVAFDTTLTIKLHEAVFGQVRQAPKKNVGDKQERFEAAVAHALRSATPAVFDEIAVGAHFGQVEIDVIVRWRNQIVFCEVNHQDLDKKAQKSLSNEKVFANLKQKLDQLSTASGRDYFGTYIKKAVIFAGTEDNMHPDYVELSKAQNVQTIPLPFRPSQDESKPLLTEDASIKLVERLSKILKPRV